MMSDKKMLNVCVSGDVVAQLVHEVDFTGCSSSFVVERALRQYFAASNEGEDEE